jgi:hypothetical protein
VDERRADQLMNVPIAVQHVWMALEHAKRRKVVELTGVVLADGSDWKPSAHHVISLLKAHHLVL